MDKLRALLVIILVLNLSVAWAFASTDTNISKKASPVYSFGVRIVGKGKPMILIPGLKGSADTYNEIVAHYKDHFKCYVITLAGFAGQPASAELEHPLQKQRDDIIRFIENEHLSKPVLVGFSFGGELALWITTTRPDLVGPLIELDGVPFDDGIENPTVNVDSIQKDNAIRHKKILSKNDAYWKHVDSVRLQPAYRREGFVYLKKLASDSLRINEILRWDDMSDYKATALMSVEADGLDLRDSVAKIQSPVLVLGSWQGWDNVKTKEEAEKRYRAQYAPVKDLTVAFSENGKHFLMWEDFDWMIGQMDQFLNSHKPAN